MPDYTRTWLKISENRSDRVMNPHLDFHITEAVWDHLNSKHNKSQPKSKEDL